MRWRRYGGCKITSSAALAGSTLYIGDYCGRLLALNARERRDALVAERQRPRLRHAGGRGRARLRPELDRRLADGVLDARALSLAPQHRLVRLLVAGGRAGTRLLRLVQRRLLRPVCADGRDALVARHRRPDLRRGGRRRRRRVRRLVRASHPRRRRAQRPRRARTSPTVSTCRSRAPASACSCTATRASMPWRSGEASRDRGRRAPAARRRRRCRVLPARQAAVARRQGIVDGRVRDDAGGAAGADRRSRASRGRPTATIRSGSASATASRSRRRSSASGRSARRASSSFPPPSLRPPLLHQQRRRAVRDRREERPQARWKYDSHRCIASSPAVDGHVVYETFMNAPPCNRKPSGKLTGELVAFTVGDGRVLWRKTIYPSESSPVVVARLGLRRRLERARLCVQAAERQDCVG